ncbi:MAG: c-type cytochrome [Gammaproteobacteria bacterium]
MSGCRTGGLRRRLAWVAAAVAGLAALPHSAAAGTAAGFVPPAESQMPGGSRGRLIRLGEQLFVHSGALRGKYVGNGLSCNDCHLGRGRHADAAPMWAAYAAYPASLGPAQRADRLAGRIQACFVFSMNGTAPPKHSRAVRALVAYARWLATGAPAGVSLPGRGYPNLPPPSAGPDPARGKKVYADKCAICHGRDGAGQRAGTAIVFPPLWGKDSFNWGGGMHRIDTAAAFIKANMPLGQPNSLSDRQAWDVAAYMDRHERPQDPRYAGDLEDTRRSFHDHDCLYGRSVDGRRLGAHASGKPYDPWQLR